MNEITPKLLNWASILDINAELQAGRTSRLPFVERVALMPDAHVGIGATVGSVIGTHGAIMPAAVGVDIGCGMAAVEYDLDASDLPDDLDQFMPSVEKAIPAGMGQGHVGGTNAGHKWWKDSAGKFTSVLDVKQQKTLIEQFGSLGGGNHFVEVCLDERDKVWLVLHSGSRGLGNKLGQAHIKKAKEVVKAKQIGLEDPDLAYFEDTDPEFAMYIGDMLACQDYARGNRDLMLKRLMEAFIKFVGKNNGGWQGWKIQPKQIINCHHNFTQMEHHGGVDLWVTRKGAIKADVGDKGIIPGSMGTKSYIVSGLGNADSFTSCSHGAGRVHSRSAAKKLFTQEDLAEAMEGIAWLDDRGDQLIDEIPQAYKDIDQVMADQADLVSVDHTLRQILNYKG